MESRKTRSYFNRQKISMRKPRMESILLSRSNELSNEFPFTSCSHLSTKSEFKSQPISSIQQDNDIKNTKIQLQKIGVNVEKENIEKLVENSSKPLIRSQVNNGKTTKTNRSIFRQALKAVVQQVESEKAKIKDIKIVNSSEILSSSVAPASKVNSNDNINCHHHEEKNESNLMNLSNTTLTKKYSHQPKTCTQTAAQELPTDELKLDENKNTIVTKSSINSTEKKVENDIDNEDLLKKIMYLINAYPAGIIEHQMPIYYKQRYNENLTKSWVKLIAHMDIKVEPSIGSFNILSKK